METENRAPGGGRVAQCSDQESCAPVSCEVCLKEVPADAVNLTDAQDYVHHFCGLDCLELWQKQAAIPGKQAG